MFILKLKEVCSALASCKDPVHQKTFDNFLSGLVPCFKTKGKGKSVLGYITRNENVLKFSAPHMGISAGNQNLRATGPKDRLRSVVDLV